MQYFSDKPITLVYGPNSIGKSSLLHSQLYLNFHSKFQSNIDLYNNSFAGENLDLGGFENIVYKHDINSVLHYEYKVEEQKDILKVLSLDEKVKDLLLDNSIDYQYSLADIETKINQYIGNTKIKFNDFLIYQSYIHEKIINHVLLDNDSDGILQDKVDFFTNHFIEFSFSSYYSQEEFITIFLEHYSKLSEYLDNFGRLIFATNESIPLRIKNTLLLFHYLANITTINYSIQILSENEIQTFVNFCINNHEIFEYHLNNEEWKINSEHELFNILCNIDHNIQTGKYVGLKAAERCFSLLSLERIVNTLLNETDLQYYGPLRHYPQRWEMNLIGVHKPRESIKEKITVSKFTIMILKINKKIHEIRKNTSDHFLIKLVSLPLDIFTLIFLYFPLLLSKNYRQNMWNDTMKDIFNGLLPERFQLMRKSKLRSNEIWKKLAISHETVKKLNNWLSDSNKLKSNYKIELIKEKINPSSYIAYLFYKILGSEKTYYAKREEASNINQYDNLDKIMWPLIKVIGMFIDKIYGMLKIKNEINISKVQFKDITKNTEVTPRDMGLGISQMLPILISTMSSKNTKMYLEQPELHLHPAVQMELMDEFIRSHNENQNEFMMESHSEHMLLRVMKRIRQTNDGTLKDESLRLTPDDVCLLYVDNDGEQTYIQELRLSKNGKLLDHWPNGFFEEGYKERFF